MLHIWATGMKLKFSLFPTEVSRPTFSVLCSNRCYFYASFYTTYTFDSFYIQWYISLHRRLHRSKWIEIDSILTLGINHFCYKVIWQICDILFKLEIPLSFIRLLKWMILLSMYIDSTLYIQNNVFSRFKSINHPLDQTLHIIKRNP